MWCWCEKHEFINGMTDIVCGGRLSNLSAGTLWSENWTGHENEIYNWRKQEAYSLPVKHQATCALIYGKEFVEGVASFIWETITLLASHEFSLLLLEMCSPLEKSSGKR